MDSSLVSCPNCGQRNRTPAAATGRPRCGKCRQWLPWIAAAGDTDYAEIVEQSPLPVLVDLWATWCGPCRQLSPALEELAADGAGALKLVKIDVDAASGLAQQFGVRSVPTLLVIDRGEVLARRTGAAPLSVLRGWVDQFLH